MSFQPDLFSDESDLDESASVSDENSLKQPGWIHALLDLPGVGPKRAMEIINKVQTADRLLELNQEDFHRLTRVNIEIPRNISPTKIELDEDYRVFGFFDSEYPAQFRDLSDPPLLIWCRGEIPNEKMLTVVGTRHPTPWGTKVSTAAGEMCAAANVATVSGLAFGIDIAAHKGSLKNNGKTVAILGSGIDLVTPRKHSRFADEIVDSGGCLISEVPPGTEPSAGTLVARNRLQAALGQALLMVQCGIPSGTLHTVKFARTLGRAVAVPEPPMTDDAEVNAGNDALLASPQIGNHRLGKLAIPAPKSNISETLADAKLAGINDLGIFIQGL